MLQTIGPIHTKPDEFENGGLTLNNPSNVLLHTSRGNFKTQQPPIILELCLRKIRSGNMTIVTSSFSRSSVFKMVFSTRKRNAGSFKFLRFEGFETLRFRDRLVWMVGLAVESNFSGVV